MPVSAKYLANTSAMAQMSILGIKQGSVLIHRATGIKVLLGVRNEDGSFWAMTIKPGGSKGKLKPVEIMRDYELSS